jgi:hypothetical protein
MCVDENRYVIVIISRSGAVSGVFIPSGKFAQHEKDLESNTPVAVIGTVKMGGL